MTAYKKPARWADPANRLFPYQVGFTAPPHDFDAAPTDFRRMAPEGVGVHGRMLHVPGYAHELAQRADNFHLLKRLPPLRRALRAHVRVSAADTFRLEYALHPVPPKERSPWSESTSPI